MNVLSGPPSPQAQEMLKALQDAVTKELQRKKNWDSTPSLGTMVAPFRLVTTCR